MGTGTDSCDHVTAGAYFSPAFECPEGRTDLHLCNAPNVQFEIRLGPWCVNVSLTVNETAEMIGILQSFVGCSGKRFHWLAAGGSVQSLALRPPESDDPPGTLREIIFGLEVPESLHGRETLITLPATDEEITSILSSLQGALREAIAAGVLPRCADCEVAAARGSVGKKKAKVKPS